MRSAGPHGEESESLECFASILQVLGAPKPDVAIKAPEGDSAWLDPGCGHHRGGAQSEERVCQANGPPCLVTVSEPARVHNGVRVVEGGAHLGKNTADWPQECSVVRLPG